MLVTFLYLRREGRPTLPVLLPLVGVLVITSLAMFMNLVNNALKGDYLLAGVSGIILILEVAIILESVYALRSESRGVQA